MGAALAVHDPAERPNWLEALGVLLICASILAGLSIVDDRAARREASRAAAVLAERADRAAERAARESMTAPAATGASHPVSSDGSPIVIPAGPSWGAGTSVVPEPVQTPASIRRIEGSREPRPALPAPPQAPEPAAAAARVPHDGADPVLLLLMGGAGLSMAGAGLRLVSRRSA